MNTPNKTINIPQTIITTSGERLSIVSNSGVIALDTIMRDRNAVGLTSTLSDIRQALDTHASQSGLWSVKGQIGTMTHTIGVATNTSSQILPANSNRKYLLIHNPGANVAWIAFGVAAVANVPSIKLVAGASFILESNFICSQAVNAIRNATVNVDLSIVEGT